MSPFLATRLEVCHENPGSLSSVVVAATAYDAKCEILRLENILAGATVAIAHALNDGEIGERVHSEFEELHKEMCDVLKPEQPA